MIRKAFVMSVDPAKHREYEQRHNPVWPEMLAMLSRHGVRNYSIFLHRETSQLFGYAEIESEERWQAIARTPECGKWWAFMHDIMPSNPDHSPKSADLREVFHLD